jgi:hypothetical protein
MLSQVVPQQQAIECLEKVLALEPNHAEAIERLSNLQKAASYLNEVDFSIEDISEPHNRLIYQKSLTFQQRERIISAICTMSLQQIPTKRRR